VRRDQGAGLIKIARAFLKAEARHLSVPADLASVIARRTEGKPEGHVTTAAEELVRHLAALPDA
jgi:hypothetical protein